MSELSISEVAREAGVRPSTIRYYESIGLLASPSRRGGKRHYNPAILQRLAIIRTAQQAGFTLDEVRLLFNEILQPDHAALAWQALIDKKLTDLKALLRHVQQMQALLEEMRQCADAELEECIYRTGQSYPV